MAERTKPTGTKLEPKKRVIPNLEPKKREVPIPLPVITCTEPIKVLPLHVYRFSLFDVIPEYT